MKQIKNKIFPKLILSFAIILVFTILFAAIFSLNTYSISFAEENPEEIQESEQSDVSNFENFKELLVDTIDENGIIIEKRINISQEGHRFTAEDFVKVKDEAEDKEYYTIYTNKTITIDPGKFGIGSITTINGNSGNLKQTYGYPKYTGTTEDELNNYTPNYFVFKIDAEQIYKITININGINFKFCIIQSTVNFNQLYANFNTNEDNSNKVSWNLTFDNNTTKSVILPEAKEYKNVELTFPYGTMLNPVYVNFHYNGNSYLLSRYVNDDGKIITTNENAVNENDKIIENSVNKTNFNDAYKLLFNKSGVYEVTIYDKTYSSYNTKNMQTCKFTVKNPAEPFYISVTEDIAEVDNKENDQSNLSSIIMSGQYTNNNVKVEFVNIEDETSIESVVITRTYDVSGSKNATENYQYLVSELTNTPKIFDKDGYYVIYVKNSNGNDIEQYTYIFRIIQTVQKSFELDGEIIEPTSGQVNEIQKIIKTKATESVYQPVYQPNDSIPVSINTTTEYDFYVYVANSYTTIEGIKYNARTANPVTLTLRGVGEINILNATLNGKSLDLNKSKFSNGDKIELKNTGSYFIKIQDQMGATSTISFTITKSLNSATIVLIVISALTFVGLMIFIIVSRTKIKVR